MSVGSDVARRKLRLFIGKYKTAERLLLRMDSKNACVTHVPFTAFDQ